ncbi:MAG: DUF898 domain-containing protein [Proteobacteria bacterium]|nr:MAG: DUF898 domain-containing protein [Pseudomonadota bacterium]
MDLTNTDHPTSPAAAPRQTLEFRGQAGEFFRIWIVNTLLTILTLGIYSAWAKVRTRRYFLGNTFLAGSAFDFHADPVKILKGRLIMGVLFAGYAFGGRISMWIPGVAIGIFALLFPWIIVRSMAFNLSNTSHRNLRFGFKHDYRTSYKTYAFSWFITVITLGLGFPYALYRHHRFRTENSRFGSTFFKFHGAPKAFYKIYAGAVLVYIGSVVCASIVIFLLAFISKPLMVGGIALIYAGFILAAAYVNALKYNYALHETALGEVRFEAELDVWQLARLYLTNLLACLFTLGLMIPWALVRTARYKLERTHVIASSATLDSFVAGMSASENAVADAATDFWDIDLGF